METRTEDAGLSGRLMLASSWEAASGALTQSLRLIRAGVGAQDLDWEELLAPPAPGRDLVSLKSGPNPRGPGPCFLDVRCDPRGGEEVLSVGVLSSARNMEVYVGQEYCGTSRGKDACRAPDGSEQEKIILYQKHLKLETSAHACRIKLLSFGEKQCVFISKVIVHVRPVSANSSPSSPTLGSRIDLDKVQTIMESMGSKLSPGAQQLMNMVRFQQQVFSLRDAHAFTMTVRLEATLMFFSEKIEKLNRDIVYFLFKNCVPLGEQLQSVLGTTGCKHLTALQSSSGALDKSSTPFPFRTGLTSASRTENLQAFIDSGTKPPGEGNTTNHDRCKTVPPNHSLLENDLKNAVSSFLPKKASDGSLPSSELLPFLQNLCSQVNHLRVGHSTKWQEDVSKPREDVVGVAMEEQPMCSYLEKILSKNMELMEKKLVDYIDERIRGLQEHLDEKIASLGHMLQNPNSPPAGLPLRRSDSGERLSNGER